MCGGENSIFEDAINVVLQGSTAGIASFDQGRIKGEGLTMKGIKEVTGAKAAEDANKLARQQMEEAKAQALQDRENARAQNAADQLAKSRQAGGLRRTTGSSNIAGTSSVNMLGGGDEEDLLGI